MTCSVQKIYQFVFTVNILNKMYHTQKMNLIVERLVVFVMPCVPVMVLRRIVKWRRESNTTNS